MTNPFFIYLLESSICLATFYAFFEVLLRKEPLMQANRFFILAALLLSVSIPLIDIPLQQETVFASPVFVLQDIKVAAQPVAYRLPVETYALYIYLVACAFMLTRLLWQTGKLIRFFRTSHSTKTPIYHLVLTQGKLPTFSFFKLLFWDNSQILTEQQKLQVFGHEITHIRQWHSLDIMLLELLKIVFWFHPAVYLFKKDLQQTHEYLADAAVVQQHNPDGYIQLIIAQVFQASGLTLINPFSQFKTKNRIMMLQKLKHARPAFWKLALSLPLIALLVLIYSCDRETSESNPSTKTGASVTGYQEIVNKYKQKYPNLWIGSWTEQEVGSQKIISVKVVVENVTNKADKIKIEQELSQAIVGLSVQDLEKLNLILPPPPPPANEELMLPPPPPPRVVYQVVEIQPQPAGGMGGLIQFMNANIRYPEEARKNGVEGKVFIQFVVDTDGSINDVQVLKGLGHGCDEEAVRVVKAMPAWKPGVQKGELVNVRMALPVVFKLD